MIPVKDNLTAIKEKIAHTALACGRDPESIILIAVSKRKPVDLIAKAIETGKIHLGENYIQEAVQKIETLGKQSACWHFIGHLQSNKARFAVPNFEYIHTVDTIKLARHINTQAQKADKVQKILLQVNIADESTKSGAAVADVPALAREITRFDHLSLAGLMCMPPFFEDPEDARPYFGHLARIKADLKGHCPALTHLSMGMSHDFAVAIEEGATMVRVGTAIFGERA